MDILSIFFLVVGFVGIYLVFDDIQSGEYSIIRFLIEIILVCGPIVVAYFIGFKVFAGQTIIIFVLISASVIYAFTYRKKIIVLTEKILPPVYDKMEINEAVKHLRIHNSNPEDLAKYLIKDRNLPKKKPLS